MSSLTTSKTYRIRINYYTCVACGDCMVACPVNQDVLARDGKLDESNGLLLVKNSNIHVFNEETCAGCGSCIPACPVKAIDIVMKEVR